MGLRKTQTCATRADHAASTRTVCVRLRKRAKIKSAATSVPDSESAKAGLTSRVSDDGYHAAKAATDPAADPTTDELMQRANLALDPSRFLPFVEATDLIGDLRDRVVEQGKRIGQLEDDVHRRSKSYNDLSEVADDLRAQLVERDKPQGYHDVKAMYDDPPNAEGKT